MTKFQFQPFQACAPHEAGHAVASYVLGRRLLSISIVPDQYGAGLTEHVPDTSTKAAIVEEVAITLAGGPAADLWGLASNCDDDNMRAAKILTTSFAEQSNCVWNHILGCVNIAVQDLKDAIGALGSQLLVHRKMSGVRAELLLSNIRIDAKSFRDCLAACPEVDPIGCVSKLSKFLAHFRRSQPGGER